MSRFYVAAGLTLFFASSVMAAVSVTVDSDKTSVRVGETIHVTVNALRHDTLGEPAPSHAGLQLGPEWQAGAQTAESERVDSAGLIKTWHFDVVAVIETTSTITPVVILGTPPPDAPPLATNRVLGPPLTITILPAKVRPWWLPRPQTLALIASIATAVFGILRAIRRRKQNKPRVPLSPLEEAMEMMVEVHANCREDRSSRFFADVERVLTGYLSRRTGRPLGSATAAEIAALAAQNVSDPAIIADLKTILQRCTTSRFSGAKTDFRLLAETEEMTRSTLERLDAVWVTYAPIDA